MDAVSHCLLGRTLGCLDAEKRLGPGSRPAFILGALAPDLDLAIGAHRWDVYLRVHEVGTHTLVASPLLALAVASVVAWCVKGARFRSLWTAAWTGVVVGHVLLDLVSGSEIRLLAPLESRRFGPHLLAMADLLAIAVLVAGTVASFWNARRAAVATLAGLSVLLLVKAISQSWAWTRLAAAPSGPSLAAVANGPPEAINGSLFAWRFFERSGDLLHTWRVDAWTGEVQLDYVRSDLEDGPAVTESSKLPVVRTFLTLARVPFARLEEADGRHFILWSDLRHCDATRCDLSFGAELGDGNRPVRQIIRIGPIEQSAPIR